MLSQHLDLRSIFAFGFPFLLYLYTLAPTIYNLDSAELTTAAATGGLARTSGYPLYMILGHLWSLIPVGDVGYRLNLFSAFNGALTVALVERILRRWQLDPWAVFGALGSLTCATFFWAMSLIAEVYTMHTAFTAALILLLLRWTERPTSPRVALTGLFLGLSLSHHGATLLLLPGIGWQVISTGLHRRHFLRELLIASITTLIGLSVYLYLPLRSAAMPSFNYAGYYTATGAFVPFDLQRASVLWWHVMGGGFRSFIFAAHGPELWQEVSKFGIYLWRAFLGFGIGPGLLGLVLLLRRNWRIGIMTLAFFLSNAAFYIGYCVIDKETMFLPNLLIWALWLGVGYDWMLQMLRSDPRKRTFSWSVWLLRGAILGIVALSLLWNLPLVDLSNDWSSRARGEEILRQVDPNALILGNWNTVPVIEFLQLVEGQRPDVKAINRFLISTEAMQELIMCNALVRSVYIDSLPSNLPPNIEAKREGKIYELSRLY